jgi:hypothetical protein
MEDFKTWGEMTVLEQYACTYWDMYKDAYGVRPRGIDTSAWTREMALRWIHEAEGSNGDDEYLCYLIGLPYGYFRRETV